MRVTIDIQDNHAIHVLDVLKSISTISIVETEEKLLNSLKQSFNELKKVKQGKLKTRPAQDLLDEL